MSNIHFDLFCLLLFKSEKKSKPTNTGKETTNDVCFSLRLLFYVRELQLNFIGLIIQWMKGDVGMGVTLMCSSHWIVCCYSNLRPDNSLLSSIQLAKRTKREKRKLKSKKQHFENKALISYIFTDVLHRIFLCRGAWIVLHGRMKRQKRGLSL